MYINQIDILFDKVLDELYKYIINNKLFDKINKDTNFVRYQNDIMELIKNFIISIKELLKNIEGYPYESAIINIIKRYSAFYIFLGISYYYKGGRDLFITNLLESSKSQKDSIIQITNFFNSNNNSKIINFYNDIKNILSLMEYKTIDKIKIILKNNPIKYKNTIELFNDLGEDYLIENIFIEDNFHTILKTLIFKQIYLKEEKSEINNILKEIDEVNAEYKYIEVVVSNDKKIVDFNIIQKFLNITQNKKGFAEDIYNYLVEMQEEKEFIIKENEEFINFLFSNKILIPISEDFLRYHKNTEKYDTTNKNKEDTKVKYVINKINNIKNYYSPLVENNQKLKLEIKDTFYKNMEDRLAVLYNDDEELKIIQKLNYSDTTNDKDNDNLIDIEDIRKYAYLNFKYASKDSIKIRPSSIIDSIRYTNLNKHKKSDKLELRIGHTNLDLTVVGVVWNPYRLNLKETKLIKPLECFTVDKMINVNKKLNMENGYTAFIKIIKNTINNKLHDRLYYWLFNNNTDIPKQTVGYNDYSINDVQKNINLLLFEIYNIYSDFVKTKLENYIDKIDDFNFWYLDNLFKIYQTNYFNFELNPKLKNELLFRVLSTKIKELEITEDESENIIPGIRKSIIKLPSINIIKDDKNIILIDENKIINNEIVYENNNIVMCNHYIKWANIKGNKTEDFNQLVFEFVKKYVKLNDKGDFICKSCNEMLQLRKYVYEGTYNAETDTFMTTSLAVNQKLEEIPKYKTLTRTINNLNKNIEKIAYLCDINFYLGNSSTSKLHRKTLIKDIIDLIQIHSKYLKTQPKNRSELVSQKYNINKNLTNLFFFELKDDIFLISSTDTDYYKTIKYNNVIAYVTFLIMTELNSGQILNFKDDKRCNYFLFSKVGNQLFEGLYIRLNQKEKTLITKIPLLCYVLFYISCILSNNKLWLFNDTGKEISNNIIIQKNIIHTVLDLINSIIEANMIEGKDYLYEIIVTRFMIKLNHIFNDTQLLARIEKNSNKNIRYDENTKKVSIIKNKIDYISINNNNISFNNTNKEYCEVKKGDIQKIRYLRQNDKTNFLTNCENGKYHHWMLKDNLIICNLCNQNYNELLKDTKRIKKDESSDYLHKIKINQLLSLSKKYCLSGNQHQIDQNTSICSICSIDPLEYKFSEKELLKLSDNLNLKENKEINLLFEKEKQYEIKEIEKNKLYNKLYKKFNKKFNEDIRDKYKSNQYINYLTDFIDRLINILGPKIKVQNKNIYLKDTLYIINHDYLGNLSKTNINILSGENLIQIKQNFIGLNKDILFYKDKINNVYVYYDLVTLQYLGYSEDNKNVKKNKNNVSLIRELSILDILLTIGLENEYYNVKHLNINHEFDKNLLNSLIRNRIINLKQIILKFESIINSVRNHSNINSRIYNLNERNIINEFKKKLKEFNIKDVEDHNTVFKHIIYMVNNINLNKLDIKVDYKLINDTFIDCKIFNNLYNVDSKLIYYLIMNLNKLLNYNNQPAIESELAHLIIKIIKMTYTQLNIDYTNSDIRKYDYILINSLPYMDEQMRVVGIYNELTNIQDIDEDKLKEENDILNEENNAFDIDDYEVDDDIDGNIEAFDGFE
jgi:hypothetical protein